MHVGRALELAVLGAEVRDGEANLAAAPIERADDRGVGDLGDGRGVGAEADERARDASVDAVERAGRVRGGGEASAAVRVEIGAEGAEIERRHVEIGGEGERREVRRASGEQVAPREGARRVEPRVLGAVRRVDVGVERARGVEVRARVDGERPASTTDRDSS